MRRRSARLFGSEIKIPLITCQPGLQRFDAILVKSAECEKRERKKDSRWGWTEWIARFDETLHRANLILRLCHRFGINCYILNIKFEHLYGMFWMICKIPLQSRKSHSQSLSSKTDLRLFGLCSFQLYINIFSIIFQSWKYILLYHILLMNKKMLNKYNIWRYKNISIIILLYYYIIILLL